MLDFRCANAKGQGPESAMCRSMRIAANHGHARQGGALFRANHVNDALTRIIHAEFGDTELITVGVQRIDLIL